MKLSVKVEPGNSAVRNTLWAAIAALVFAFFAIPAQSQDAPRVVVVLVSADAEWKAVTRHLPNLRREKTPFGEWAQWKPSLILFHGGWGKIAAAGSTQYAIDRWHPELIVNIGTCGGFRGSIEKGTVLLVDRTVVYDIVEQMGSAEEAIQAYETTLDLSWLGGDNPKSARKSVLISGDRDIVASEIAALRDKYGAVAADWESGAIAYVAKRNGVPALILRGVTDLVGAEGGEVYGNETAWEAETRSVMNALVDQLPSWLARWNSRSRNGSVKGTTRRSS